MPWEQWSKYRLIEGSNVEVEYLSKAWNHSPRYGGKLYLVANPLSYTHHKLLQLSNRGGWIPDGVPAQIGLGGALASAEAESYAKLRGKLYKGSAALGMTLSTYKQSREMIVNRYTSLNVSIAEFMARGFKGRRKGKQVSSLYLEYVFGWAPMLADIKAACLTVIQQAPETGFLSASSTKPVAVNLVDSSPYYRYTRTTNGVVRVTRATGYTVDNPNLWLLERAGLLNPMAIAWDRVPWSFVVNMFANTGSLVNSITDFVGLGFHNASTTTATRTTQFIYHYENVPGGKMRVAGGSTRTKNRAYGATARPPLQLKLPGANWELAAIAGSLVTQKLASTQWMQNLTYSKGR